MKWLPILLLVSLAGCVNEEPEAEETSVWGRCPHYVSGPSGTFTAEGGELLIDFNQTELDGYALDLYELQVNTTGAMELRFYAGERQLGVVIYEPEPTTRPFLAVDGEQSAAVYLTSIDYGTAPAPGPLRVTATGDGALTIEATAWFRVCGR